MIKVKSHTRKRKNGVSVVRQHMKKTTPKKSFFKGYSHLKDSHLKTAIKHNQSWLDFNWSSHPAYLNIDKETTAMRRELERRKHTKPTITVGKPLKRKKK